MLAVAPAALRFARALATAVVLALLAACGGPDAEYRFEGPTMGTSYHITVVQPPADLSREAIETRIRNTLQRVDMLMSTWREDSEIMRVNRAEVGNWVALSPENLALIRRSLQLYEQSEGRFDITVGPLVDLWGFGAANDGLPRVPTPQEIEATMQRTGSAALELRDAPPAIRKNAPREIDFAAIAPGYAVDLLAGEFAALGIVNFMIELGGEVRTAGSNPGGGKWRIGIEAPERAQGGIVRVIALGGESVSTSGDYRDWFEYEGKRYSHTIDPRSGRPIAHALASVTVIADDCTSADGYATALDVMGPDEGLAFAERHGLAVYMLVRLPDGGFSARASSAFSAYSDAPTH